MTQKVPADRHVPVHCSAALTRKGNLRPFTFAKTATLLSGLRP